MDVIVVGAGPSGCAAAMTAARAGLDVLLIDKAAQMPREKTCGDALTPRAVGALAALGLEIPDHWHRSQGIAVYGDHNGPFVFEWPASSGLPTLSCTVRRSEFDYFMLQAAEAAGAKVRLGVAIHGPITDGDRVIGVSGGGEIWLAPVVIDATGAAARLGVPAGMPRLTHTPMGVAARGYMRACGILPDEKYLHSWMAMPEPDSRSATRLVGYGWVFPMGEGLYNVGIGQLSTGASFGRTDHKAMLQDWVKTLPAQWGMTWVDADGTPTNKPEVQSAALPMGLNRQVVYRNGTLLAGDAAGLVSPYDGEGVSWGLESGTWAGQAAAAAKAAGFGTPAGEQALQGYHWRVKAQVGRYYRGGAAFTKLMGNPTILAACLKYGLPNKSVMRVVNKMMAGLVAPKGGPVDDRILRFLLKVVFP
ncbi:MAG: geranylgeranyl reductase family protein [Propionibacteriaceae bacterium]|nr:geranylgeranyl reductase family protein [Propionibacteriaceae bacterium]